MSDGKLSQDAVGAFWVGVALIVLGVFVGDQTVGYALAPLVGAAFLYAMCRAPVRLSLMVLAFFDLVLEDPEDGGFAGGLWQTPFYTVGSLFTNHIKNVTHNSAMFFSVTDLVLLTLILVAVVRTQTGSKIDGVGRTPTPKPLIPLAYLSLAGTAYVEMSGMMRGGDFSISLWQVNRVFYLPIVFLLFSYGLRGPKDHAALARTLIYASLVRAVLAVYISYTVHPKPDPDSGLAILQYATSHHDSILFASGAVVVLAMVLEKVGGKAKRVALLCLPILVWGMLANNRRMVWVQIGMVFLTVYLSTPPSPLKRKLQRTLFGASPLILAYLAVGWNSKAAIFKPVSMVRSVVDPNTDASSLCREIENYDIISTIKQFPVLGTGYGNGYLNLVPLPPMGYDLERYNPHNSILGLWAYCGYFGYTMMTLLWVGGVYFGVRAYHAARRPSDRAAALMSFGAVLIYMVQCWGDMGLGSWTGVFLVAPALAVAGKVAVATGAWSDKAPARTVRAPQAAPSAVGFAARQARPAR